MRARKIKKLWLDALESGEYKQTTETLYDPDTKGFCCLGVLQHKLLEGNVQLEDTSSGTCPTEDTDPDYVDIASAPTPEFYSMFPQCKWVQDNKSKLVALNDDDRADFKQIAAYIRNNWKVS